MKKSVLIIIVILLGYNLFAQTDNSKAFSNSYLHESNGQYLESISDLQAVYSESSYSMNLRLGWLFYLSGDYYKSMTYYTNAINLESNSIEARLGYVYPLAALQNWDSVLETYMTILSIDPKNTLVNYRVGYIYYLREDMVSAEKSLIKVLELYPFDYDSNLLLGSVYMKMGKIKEAKIYFNRALEFNPSSIEVQGILKTI